MTFFKGVFIVFSASCNSWVTRMSDLPAAEVSRRRTSLDTWRVLHFTGLNSIWTSPTPFSGDAPVAKRPASCRPVAETSS